MWYLLITTKKAEPVVNAQKLVFTRIQENSCEQFSGNDQIF